MTDIILLFIMFTYASSLGTLIALWFMSYLTSKINKRIIDKVNILLETENN